VDPQRLVQRVVEQGAMVAELLPQHLLGLGLIEVGRRRAGMLPLPLPLRPRHGAIGGGGRVTTRPRRRASGAVASRSHPPASLAPPPRARGLARASSPIGPIQAAGRHRQGFPPWLSNRQRRGQALVEPLTRRWPQLYPSPQPPPPVATPRLWPCHAVAQSSPPRSLSPMALLTSIASWARTRPTWVL
jgi:hypothetical protein